MFRIVYLVVTHVVTHGYAVELVYHPLWTILDFDVVTLDLKCMLYIIYSKQSKHAVTFISIPVCNCFYMVCMFI